MSNIIITKEINDEQKLEVCRLIYQGFYKKLANYWIFEKNIDKGIQVLNDCVNYNNGIYALEEGKVVGFVGLQYRRLKFKNFSKENLRKHYNIFGSAWRVIFNKFENTSDKLKEDEMYIDLIVVDSNSRGKGIATKLIDKVEQISIENNFEKVLLDVVDTNENAIKLYKRLGYKIMKTANFKGLTDSMGFREVNYMKKELKK